MEKVIVIVGPTAVGKTKVSIDLAKKLQTEIISGDSMLVYRGMDIGTAKPSNAERDNIIHHLIDIIDPQEEFNVTNFQYLARNLISSINKGNKIPIVAGGTGLYVKALLEDYLFSTSSGNEELRCKLTDLANQYGSRFLHKQLQEVSPETAARLHPNDQRRIIRALEVFSDSGTAVSQSKNQLIYVAAVIGLSMDRQKLYERINMRVDTMIANGLIEEVQTLLNQGVSTSNQSMQAIGYKEIIAYLEGNCDLHSAINQIKQSTRHFAKRQLTWYRKMPYIKWFSVEQYSYPLLLEYIYKHIAEKLDLQ